MLDEEELNKYKEAGRILSEVREESKSLVKECASLLEIADAIEDLTRKKGAEVAFPACLSLNDMAAHYAPGKSDASIIPEGAIIKVDLGAHVDGYIADTAYTIAFNSEHQQIVDASVSALDAAIEQCYTGNDLGNVSAAIEAAIKEFNLAPISNLTGHGLERYWLHASPSVPNVKSNSMYKLKEGQVLAIEPFATNGAGRVKDAEFTSIFRISSMKPVRNPEARKILDFAANINGLPFAERWLPIDSVFKLRLALRELRDREILYEYPALKDAASGLVSQAEHTVIVSEKPIVTTK